MKVFRGMALAVLMMVGGVLLPGISSQQAAADVDVYTTPGTHNVNGRQWRTTCAAYSSNIDRCRTEIWASVIELNNGRFKQVNGWAFNNLTYKPVNYSLWGTNPLARPATWTDSGRQWRTECGSAATGRDACRSYIYSTVYTRTATGFAAISQWTFNNIVRFTPGTADYPAPTTQVPTTPAKPTTPATPAKPSSSQEQAIKMAQEYLSFMAFSRSGLIDQLEYEGFSTADATFGVDYLKVNWNAQAAAMAREYLNVMAFSRSGLIDQLVFEGFTYDQAVYGVNAVGL